MSRRVLLLPVLAALALSGALAVLGACTGEDPAPGASNADAGSALPDAGGTETGTTGDAGTGTPDAAAWTPATLDQAGTLALWLEASSANLVLSSGAIGKWKDLSKNQNDAINTVGGPSVESAVVNGHDAVHFTALTMALEIADAPSLQLVDDQFYLVAVGKSAHRTGYFFSKATTGVGSGGPPYAMGLELFVASGTNAGTTVSVPSAHIDSQSGNSIEWIGAVFDDSKFHLVALRRTNAFTLALAADDRPAQTASTGDKDVSEPGAAARIGWVEYGNVNPLIDFSIAELLIVHDAKSHLIADTDVASLRAYLKQKYGL